MNNAITTDTVSLTITSDELETIRLALSFLQDMMPSLDLHIGDSATTLRRLLERFGYLNDGAALARNGDFLLAAAAASQGCDVDDHFARFWNDNSYEVETNFEALINELYEAWFADHKEDEREAAA